jgi:hypothetical protein
VSAAPSTRSCAPFSISQRATVGEYQTRAVRASGKNEPWKS